MRDARRTTAGTAALLTMHADYAVELGKEDETLELPWAAPDGGPRYIDLKREPERINEIEEAKGLPELRDFLVFINSQLSHLGDGSTRGSENGSALQSAKCDAWSTSDIHPEEEIFEVPWKFGSYVDFFFSESAEVFRQSPQVSVEGYEEFLRKIVALLKRAPELPATAEFLLRRCYFHEKQGDLREGFYVTFYLFGFGQDESKARQQWASAMNLARNAFAQLNSGHPVL
jgi:hypothetical protein